MIWGKSEVAGYPTQNEKSWDGVKGKKRIKGGKTRTSLESGRGESVPRQTLWRVGENGLSYIRDMILTT